MAEPTWEKRPINRILRGDKVRTEDGQCHEVSSAGGPRGGSFTRLRFTCGCPSIALSNREHVEVLRQ